MTDDDSGRTSQLSQQVVDALYYAFGTDHARAMYPQGTMLEGSFVPAAGAHALCSARLFAHSSAKALVRFSDLQYAIGRAAPVCHHGFALKLRAPHEAEFDVVAHSYDGFPCRTAEEFRELLVAIGLSRDSEAPSTPLGRFLHTHPAAAAFLNDRDEPPSSYAAMPYFGVNAFRFTNPSGEQCHVRYRFVPRADRGMRPNACLGEEIVERVSRGPVIFDWLAQIAEPADAIDDPSLSWPDTRRLEHLGSITLDQLVSTPEELDRKTLFLPANLPDGIARADPMLLVRNAAYPLSYRRRQ